MYFYPGGPSLHYHKALASEKNSYCQKNTSRGTWVAQSLKCPTLAQVMIDLTVHGFEPSVGLCADSSEPGAYFRF